MRLAIWSAAGFNFVIAIGQCLTVVVADNEAGAVVVNGPGRREMRQAWLRDLRTDHEHAI